MVLQKLCRITRSLLTTPKKDYACHILTSISNKMKEYTVHVSHHMVLQCQLQRSTAAILFPKYK